MYIGANPIINALTIVLRAQFINKTWQIIATLLVILMYKTYLLYDTFIFSNYKIS